jgi:hypothetical protein
MPKAPLTKDSEFTVGEEKVLLYIMAILFFALFMYGLIDAIRRHFTNIDYQSIIFAFALLPAIYCIRRAKSNRVYIRINKKGIFKDEKLVTDWAGFVKASLTQKPKTRIIEIQDNFLLILEYRKAGIKQHFRSQIPLTNTQNKSEEDVLQAVSFFWNLYKNAYRE